LSTAKAQRNAKKCIFELAFLAFLATLAVQSNFPRDRRVKVGAVVGADTFAPRGSTPPSRASAFGDLRPGNGHRNPEQHLFHGVKRHPGCNGTERPGQSGSFIYCSTAPLFYYSSRASGLRRSYGIREEQGLFPGRPTTLSKSATAAGPVVSPCISSRTTIELIV
jgi:hypothetical protein